MISHSYKAIAVYLWRDRVEKISESRQLLEELREALDGIISTALRRGIQKSKIKQVFLTRGSSLIPGVQQLAVPLFWTEASPLFQILDKE